MSAIEISEREPEEAGAEGTFFAVPPFVGPVMEWKPEYGTIDDDGHTVDLGGGIHVYSSPDFTFDVNSMFVTTSEGVAVVDSQMIPKHAERVIEEIKARTDKPIRYVTNSHHHPDHTFGNPVFVEAGAELVSSYFTARMIDGTSSSDLMFMFGMYGEYAPEYFAVPRNTFVRSKELWLGKTVIQLFEFADSTTTAGEAVNMTMAWLPQSKVLHVGDTVEPGSHTFFAEGVSVPDWLVQLGHLRELVKELKPKVIVPGHGAPGDAGMIDEQERYLRTVAKIVEDHCRGGEQPIDPETAEKLRAAIVAEFPHYSNPIPLDISLEMMQMLGPLAFLAGRPEPAPAPGLPAFR